MFLPVILLREWGWRGFWLFAAVNVLGAAAVGFLWTRARSEAFIARRRVLLVAFSLATISFQASFMAWMGWSAALDPLSTALGESGPFVSDLTRPWFAWLVASGAIVLVTMLGGSRRAGWRELGGIATIGSLLLWLAYGTEGWRLVGDGSAPAIDLWFIAPAISLGFIVCPHLDLSFHRVVGSGAGRLAWVVFAVAFLPMLLFAASSFGLRGPLVAAPLVAWWFVQASFTAAVHAREVRLLALPGANGLVVLALVIGAVAGAPIFGGEPTYLRFLGLYGAVFPGIALLLWRGYRSLGILGWLAVAIPCFEAGFLGIRGLGADRIAWAILPPIALLLGLLIVPINNEVVRDSASGSAPMR